MERVDEKRVMVFVNTQRQCDNVHRHLEELGYRCTILHGGKTQDQREAGIKGFRYEGWGGVGYDMAQRDGTERVRMGWG